MAIERFINDFQTTLSSGINDSTTSIPVNAATSIASQFRAKIDDEIIIITANGDTTTWTATRGAEGTSAVSHSSGATVTVVLTSGAVNRIGFGKVLLATQTANNVASIDFSSVFTSDYDVYEIEILGVVPITDDGELIARVESAGSFISTGTYSHYLRVTRSDNANAANFSSSSATSIRIMGASSGLYHGLQNNTAAAAYCTMLVYGTQLVKESAIKGAGESSTNGASGNGFMHEFGGVWHSTAVVTGIQFLFVSGNISAGIFNVWGLPKSS